MNSFLLLRSLLDQLPPRLTAVSPTDVDHKPSPTQWSRKEELGHLLDSAVNNHRRIVLIQLEDKPALPNYDGEKWVELNGYQHRDWHELIDLWRALNVHLLAAAEGVPDSAWSRTCTIGDSKPLTLQFVFDDYLEHMLHHLRHMGIAVDDLKSAATAMRQAGD